MQELADKELLTRVFDATGIKGVVSIDDAYAENFIVDEVLTLYKLVPNHEVVKVLFAEIPGVTVGDEEVTDADLKREWSNLSQDVKRRVVWALRNATGQQSDFDRLDYRALTNLKWLLGNDFLTDLSYQQWKGESIEKLTSKGKTLFLVIRTCPKTAVARTMVFRSFVESWRQNTVARWYALS